MAELTAFHYKKSQSWLHLLDVRIKLVMIFLFNMISIQAGYTGLILLSIPVVIIILLIGFPIIKSLYEVRYFLYFLFFILLSRSVSFDFNQPFFLAFLQSDFIDGALICWRLFLILLVGLLFMHSSKITEMKVAVQWFLKHVPFVPERKIALMIGLMIRFLPDVMQQAADIREAQLARCINRRKNPVFRITSFAAPLLIRIFEQAEIIVQAMLSRCYREDRTEIVLEVSVSGWIILLVSSGYLVGLFIFVI